MEPLTQDDLNEARAAGNLPQPVDFDSVDERLPLNLPREDVSKWGGGRLIFRRPEVAASKMKERYAVQGRASLKVLGHVTLESLAEFRRGFPYADLDTD